MMPAITYLLCLVFLHRDLSIIEACLLYSGKEDKMAAPTPCHVAGRKSTIQFTANNPTASADADRSETDANLNLYVSVNTVVNMHCVVTINNHYE
jgi:hypothetical protein